MHQCCRIVSSYKYGWYGEARFEACLRSWSVRGTYAEVWTASGGFFVRQNVNSGLIIGRLQRVGDETAPQGSRRKVEIDFDDLFERTVD